MFIITDEAVIDNIVKEVVRSENLEEDFLKKPINNLKFYLKPILILLLLLTFYENQKSFLSFHSRPAQFISNFSSPEPLLNHPKISESLQTILYHLAKV